MRRPLAKRGRTIWVELQSLCQDTQAFRMEAYHLRVAGSLYAVTNERLHTQELQLERARRRHLTANGRPHWISCLFTQPKLIEGLLCFLEETGFCAKPRTEWEPG